MSSHDVNEECVKEIHSIEGVKQWFRRQWDAICLAFPEDHKAGRLDRLHRMLQVLSGEVDSHVYIPEPLQSPYSFYLPGLTARPFHDELARTAPWSRSLEDNYEIILAELMSVLNRPEDVRRNTMEADDHTNNLNFLEYQGDGVQDDKGLMTERGGDWKVLYFYHNFTRQDAVCRACPRTAHLVDTLPEMLRGMVCFSSLDPGTHIIPHYGPSNMRLTAHLGLIHCDAVTITCGAETRPYQEGKVLILDDSFQHEVHHRGSEPRITLMLDVWHPELAQVERDAFHMVMRNSIGTIDRDYFYHSLHVYKNKNEAGKTDAQSETNRSRDARVSQRTLDVLNDLFSLLRQDK